MVNLNGFAGLDGLTSEYMRNHFIIFWNNGEFWFTVKMLMYVHFESDCVCKKQPEFSHHSHKISCHRHTAPKMAPIIVDNETKLKTLLAHITRCVWEQEDQLVFIELEGVNLSRFGKIAIMQMLLPPSPIVYLIDVHVLGPEAFEVIAEATSLKSILESKITYKVFFDIRNDSDALYAHFGVSVAGVIDLQVLEYATRQPRGKFVNGLAKCIEKDLPYQRGWSLTKAKGRRLFAPELGGRYEVFLDRPLATDIMEYREQDLMLMPRLLAKYAPLLRPAVASQIQNIVEDRIRLS